MANEPRKPGDQIVSNLIASVQELPRFELLADQRVRIYHSGNTFILALVMTNGTIPTRRRFLDTPTALILGTGSTREEAIIDAGRMMIRLQRTIAAGMKLGNDITIQAL